MKPIRNRALAPRAPFGHMGRWLPWLIAALVLSGMFRPVVTTASHPAYQSAIPYDQSPLPEAFPVQESPLPPPVELPMPADVPPAGLPAPLPTPEELAPPQVVPQEEVAPPEPAPPPAQVPGEVPQAPAAPATPARPAQTRALPPGLLIDEPVAQPPQRAEEAPAPHIGQVVINWTKFWDTVVLYASYPWLCCGILLLLGVPLAFLLLEIRGRRRPRVLPERPARRQQPPDAAPKP